MEPKKGDQWSTVAGLRSKAEQAKKSPGKAERLGIDRQADALGLQAETRFHEEHR